MRTLRLVALLAALPVALFGVTACKDDAKTPAAGGSATAPSGPPAGDVLLKDSSAAMGKVKSADFAITAAAQVAGLNLHSAQGTLTREGNAKGSAQIEQFGINVEAQFVIVNDTLYLKGPTGGWQTLSKSVAATVYDPSAILDPDRGIAKVLGTATAAKTEGEETIDGKKAWRVAATMKSTDLASVVPGVSTDVPGKAWVSADDKRLLKATFTLPAVGDAKGGDVTVTFKNFDAPVTISAP
jgi:lipoprotein LprG